ncbi:unnamed protein product [Medioppia subpectinata]|uniref:Adiponectin receptor n=1 Tax=Medioppia subpectinata TaxID=1979941 RepID=A0A7R9KL26_9ACAR|nr:unnamed protein product [Medioppia subpectinata]CAG2105581.1 unnamed protein product [Medioppia subpectinata]
MDTIKMDVKYRQKSATNGQNSWHESKPVTDWQCVDYNRLPKWLQDNKYLHRQHRPVIPSFRACFASIFRIHSESGNILTHLIGFVLFAVIAPVLLIRDRHLLTGVDTLMLCIYFAGALACHLLSTVYHTCKCHSPGVCQLFHSLDFCGISLQIICSMIPAFYYGFYTRYMHLFYAYTSVGFIMFTAALCISVWPKFATPTYKPLRALVFLIFGLSNVIPGAHWFYVIEPEFVYPWALMLAQGMIYVVGALIYAGRVPERLYPGKCDLWPQSHQIFHTLVTIAAVVHFRSIYRMIYLRHDNKYLHRQHRPVIPSFRACFASIFRIHSESGNILTHLIGFLLFAVIAPVLLIRDRHLLTGVDTLMLCIYFAGALACHLLSTVYHTCKCHSPGVCQLFHSLDFCGISLQIICSMIPAFYYGFYTRYMHLFYAYTSVGFIMFTAALCISVWPKFATPTYKPLRALVFLIFGLSNVIPGAHWFYVIEPEFVYPWALMLAQGMIYVVGALIYAGRVPERLYPGKCDLWPQSHQIFHTLVTIAAVVHFRSIYLQPNSCQQFLYFSHKF